MLLAALLLPLIAATEIFSKGENLSKRVEEEVFTRCQEFYRTEELFTKEVPKCVNSVDFGHHKFTYSHSIKGESQTIDHLFNCHIHLYKDPKIVLPTEVVACFAKDNGKGVFHSHTHSHNLDDYEILH